MMPYLPFILSRVGRLGAVIEGEYGAKKTPEFQALLDRMRFDFELTKAELTYERFIVTFADWCHEKGVAIRMQGYGRGLFQLENSMLPVSYTHLDVYKRQARSSTASCCA